MAAKSLIIASFAVCLFFTALTTAIAALMIRFHKTQSLYAIDVSLQTQIKKDWVVEPYIDVKVTKDAFCPEDFPYEVFYNVWLGTRRWCDCIDKKNEFGEDLKDAGVNFDSDC